jgi:hypothetical protein
MPSRRTTNYVLKGGSATDYGVVSKQDTDKTEHKEKIPSGIGEETGGSQRIRIYCISRPLSALAKGSLDMSIDVEANEIKQSGRAALCNRS